MLSGPRFIVFLWIAALGLITYGHIKAEGSAPPASAFLGSATVYSIAATVSAFPATATLASVLALGWTLNLVYTVLVPSAPPAQGQGAPPVKAPASPPASPPVQQPKGVGA